MVTVLAITLVLCLVFWLVCYLSTGTDEKNINGFRSYPTKVQGLIRAMPAYIGKYKERSVAEIFLSNLVLFLVILFIVGLFIRTNEFWTNFFNLTIIGQGMNLFDLVVIDLLWWRNTPRIRFSQIPDKALYQDPSQHIASFARGILMYLLVAIIDAFLLSLF